MLSRKTWQVEADCIATWLALRDDAVFFRNIRKELSGMDVPRRFFARFISTKPQYFDSDSPLSMLLFAKMLRQAKPPLFLSEMLPSLKQSVVEKNGARAAEFVLEFEV